MHHVTLGNPLPFPLDCENMRMVLKKNEINKLFIYICMVTIIPQKVLYANIRNTGSLLDYTIMID